MESKISRRFDGVVARVVVVTAACLAGGGCGPAWAGTTEPLTVSVPPLSAPPLQAGVAASILLNASVTDPPQVTQETQISGPVWQWSVTSTERQDVSSLAWVATGQYLQCSVSAASAASPIGSLNVLCMRGGTWRITVAVTVDYTEPGTQESWHGSAAAQVILTCNLSAVLRVRRTGSSQYSNTADVAAGGLPGEEHKADLLVEATPAVAGIYVDPACVAGGSGSIVQAKCPMSGGVTDGNGRLSASGIFSSGDLVGAVVWVSLPSPVAGHGALSSVSIDQKWTELTPKQAWTFDPLFDYDDPETLRWRAAFDTSVGITGHSVTFGTVSISADVFNPSEGPLDPDTGQNVGAYDHVQYDKAQIDQVLAGGLTDDCLVHLLGLVTYTPAAGSGAVYSTRQEVAWDEDYIIDDVGFHAADDSVWAVPATGSGG